MAESTAALSELETFNAAKSEASGDNGVRRSEARLLQPHQPTAANDPKTKTSSFQITSVRASSSVSNDGEDDSCGEVDDSQAEAVLATLPETAIEVPVSIAQQVTDVGSFKPDHGWQGRFRVVKIESSEPFKRGRWLCMDFLDQPSVQPTFSKEEPGSGASSSGSLSDHISTDDTNQNGALLQQPVAQAPPNLVRLGYETVD